MPLSELMSSEEAISKLKGLDGKKSVLLGNGFSMAYDANRFSFTNLLETAISQGIISADSKILQIFRKLNTADFEKVIRYLDKTYLVSDIYFPDSDKEEIKSDIKQLKKHLVNTITNNHPDKSTEIDLEKSQRCAEFLSLFDNLYSLNYDLLAYWVKMQNNLNLPDGFGNAEDEETDYVVYKDSTHAMHFIHGGLHLFDHGVDTVKLTFCRTDKPLKRQIYENLLADTYPVFISEGTSDDKLEKIKHNHYLNHCYKSFKNVYGALFIFGTSLKSNDEHIKKAIIEGKFKNIFIGVFSENDLQLANNLKDEIEALNEDLQTRSRKSVFIYNSQTLNPWEYVANISEEGGEYVA